MAIDARKALRRGAAELATVHGVALYVVFTVFAVLTLPIHQTLSAEMSRIFLGFADASPGQLPTPATPLALDLSIPMLAAALAGVFVAAEALRLVAIRSFASESPRVDTHGRDTAELLGTYVVLLLASISVQVLVYGGLLAFILPGLIAAVLTVFVRQAVVLDDAGVVGSIRRSIDVVIAEFVPVSLLLVVLLALSFVIGMPASLFGTESVAGQVVGVGLTTVITVYGIAVITAAYQQVDLDEDAGNEALDADDLEGTTHETEKTV